MGRGRWDLGNAKTKLAIYGRIVSHPGTGKIKKSKPYPKCRLLITRKNISMKKEIIRILLIAAILFPMELISQVQNTIGSKDSLPLDPKITYGKLDNGFTYY